jgi:hypothetical protein
MKFELDGKWFDARFEYDNVMNPVNRVVEKTTCYISEIDQNKVGKERYTIVAQAFVVRNVKDADNRQQARKNAFSKTLDQFIPGRNNKQVRAAIWKEYLAHVRI